MKIGKLYYDTAIERIDIKFEDGTYYGGLHCGESIEFLKDNLWTDAEWLSTRIEFDHDTDDWYLVGLCAAGQIPVDNIVRK
jgi:hypothetical protein